MAAITGILERTISGRGGIVGVVGPPGVGKSRLAREAAAAAGGRGVDVVWTYCESHTSDVPFRVTSQLLTEAIGIGRLDAEAARERISAGFADADEGDVALLEDLLGVGDPAVPAPSVAADARRRRLTSMIKSATIANTNPMLYVIEDVHWIDEVSESMLADFFTVVAQTPTMVLLTFRPEYTGSLSRLSGMATIAVAPLSDSEITALVSELTGRDPSVAALTETVVARVGGNPFFAEEMIRDLAERGLLYGRRGDYSCDVEVTDIHVPVTLQATIGARIDRLPSAAKRTLSAAAVIGSRFEPDLLASLNVEPVFDDLVRAELIDQVRFTPSGQYAFRHPMIRTVAYEAQLKSDRIESHRRLAAAIEAQHPDALDENAALIAEHLEAAGDAVDAYGWHMRAGAWSFSRDSTAARASWERACRIADRLPDTETDRLAMRIAPRTMLCASVWRGSPRPVAGRFDELRELCEQSGDRASLAVGLYGLVAEHMFYGRVRESSAAASELIALLDSLENLDSSIGVAFLAIGAKSEAGDYHTVLRVAQKVIDWAEGDPTKGNLITGSPLAIALLWRATARWSLGMPGWRQDLLDAVRMAREADAGTYAMVIGVKNATATQGVLRVDDDAVREIDQAVQGAESVGDDTALGSALFGGGTALTMHAEEDVRRRGLAMMEQFRQMCVDGRFFASELPSVEANIAWQGACRGDRASALPVLRRSVEALVDIGQLVNTVIATGQLVQTLLELGTPEDVVEAQQALDRMAALPADEPFVVRDIMVLRLRALIARARGDGDYPRLVDAYRAMAESLEFEGHIAWARELAEA
ncbi:MAG TPA: AAA family ATPase [Mycobacterium sp.]|nr:AAA family ATPase [Mycobacterium sp.]